MKHYVVAELEITDRRWVAEYVRDVTPMVERHGGRYLARTGNAEWLEGGRGAGKIHLIVEWPSREAAIAFYESDDYRPYREARLAGAVNEMVLVAGEHVTNAARID